MKALTIVGGGKKGRYVTAYWEGAREQSEDNSTTHTYKSGRLSQPEKQRKEKKEEKRKKRKKYNLCKREAFAPNFLFL